jgi:hypothetical protein
VIELRFQPSHQDGGCGQSDTDCHPINDEITQSCVAAGYKKLRDLNHNGEYQEPNCNRILWAIAKAERKTKSCKYCEVLKIVWRRGCWAQPWGNQGQYDDGGGKKPRYDFDYVHWSFQNAACAEN